MSAQPGKTSNEKGLTLGGRKKKECPENAFSSLIFSPLTSPTFLSLESVPKQPETKLHMQCFAFRD